jgi:hypothetical protein
MQADPFVFFEKIHQEESARLDFSETGIVSGKQSRFLTVCRELPPARFHLCFWLHPLQQDGTSVCFLYITSLQDWPLL